MLSKLYNVGLYIRLSREDDDKGEYSESITNQKSLLMQYVKENNYNLVDIYIDDGFSGTNFNRPEFNRLINDIENNKINMVITKDMSRLGRDYIVIGNLIEKYFPEHGVRYISVTDNIDTYLDNSNNDIAPFKAVMNDMYAKDISKKIKASLKAKQKDGKFVGCRPPFGYRKDVNDKNHLVINEEQAVIVRRIFSMCLEGLSCYKIAKRLSEEKVKTPAEYYNFEWRGNCNFKYRNWNSKTIRDILINRVYTGDLVQSRRIKVNYKIKKVVKNNPDNYIIVENTHEPIVDKKLFCEAQERLPKNMVRCEKKEHHLFEGLLYCGDCGHRISITPRRKKDNKCYTICNYYRTHMNEKLCTTHSNNYDELEKFIIHYLKNMILNIDVDKQKIMKEVFSKLNDNGVSSRRKEINILNQNIMQINDNLDNIYIEKLNNKITDEQFERIRLKLERELDIKQERYKQLISNVNNMTIVKKEDKIISKYIDDFLSLKNITRELVVNLIEKVIIYENKRVDIIVTFNKIN